MRLNRYAWGTGVNPLKHHNLGWGGVGGGSREKRGLCALPV